MESQDRQDSPDGRDGRDAEAAQADALGTPPDATAQPTPPVAVRRPVRWGRGALIVAVAAVLGCVGGIGVGYGVQAEREPTPLGPLAQQGLGYPDKPLPAGQEPEPLSAVEDRQVKTDGDLRKLLVPRPDGARKSDRVLLEEGWVSLASYALYFESEDYMFETLVAADVRRIAATAWEQGQYKRTNIHLVQFHSAAGASEHAVGQHSYMPQDEDGAGNEGDPLKGSGNGRYYVYDVERKAGYLPLYRARAVVQRGTVMADINIFDTKPIGKTAIRTLAERQLERL
ncbi:hypothetical protein ACIQ7Q_17380 [Streptomyces sp. NPDC096176]|uniref:hypothetical protein n=1 Tax=Streptomyces sp. NPDC096176 TaxID=3366079 RepID=UPI0037FAE8C7